jgi:hypothetical protein
MIIIGTANMPKNFGRVRKQVLSSFAVSNDVTDVETRNKPFRWERSRPQNENSTHIELINVQNPFGQLGNAPKQDALKVKCSCKCKV